VDVALALTPLAEQEAAAPAPTLDFAGLFARWIPEHSQRPCSGSGKPLSKLAVAGLVATQARLSQYAEARGVELRPEALNVFG
jgi:hypothetical protein